MNTHDQLSSSNKEDYFDWATGIVRYSDLDPNGHVNNGAVNAFFEDGRVRFREKRMVHFGDNLLRGFALVKYSVEYKAPIFFPKDVLIGTRVTRVGKKSYSLGQALFDDEKCSAVAEVITVLIDPTTNLSRVLPDELRAVLLNAMQAK